MFNILRFSYQLKANAIILQFCITSNYGLAKVAHSGVLFSLTRNSEKLVCSMI